MHKIDIDSIIKEAGFDKLDVAKQLFPDNKLPVPALQRIRDGVSFLDSNQLQKLADMVGCTVSDLYTVEGWRAKSEKERNIFLKGDYVAELCTRSNITTVYHKGSMFHESIIHEGTVLLSEYINVLNNLISKHNE